MDADSRLPFALENHLQQRTAAGHDQARDWPHLTARLVKHLQQAFPVVNPPASATIEEVQRAAGQRDVVEMLARIHDLQQIKD